MPTYRIHFREKADSYISITEDKLKICYDIINDKFYINLIIRFFLLLPRRRS